MTEFDREVMQRKNLARQAIHKKNGSRSKKCTLPSDRLTKKQWRERCGNVVTYKVSTPMEFRSFKALPKDIQKEYIGGLVDKYQATASDIARMFGVNVRSILRICNDEEIGIHFARGKKMPKDKREEFEALFNGADTYGEAQIIEECATEETGRGDIEMAYEIPHAASQMSFDDFSLMFSGALDMQMISNSILSIVPSGSNVQIEVKCRMLD